MDMMKKVVLVALGLVLILGLLTSCAVPKGFSDFFKEPKAEVKQQEKAKDSAIKKEKAISYDIAANQEMMQTMLQIMDLQDQMLKAKKRSEKKRIANEIIQMKEKLHAMMKARADAMGPTAAK